MSKALLLLITAIAAPAQTTPPVGSYDVTVTTEAGVQTQVTLTCKPAGGSHPYRRQACKQLIKAKGEIAAIPPADGLCTTEYAPVTVKAQGTWNGTPKEFENVFSNRCVANLQTGGYVFRI